MPYSPSLISNNILNRSFKDGIAVSPMKLQKILYFVASEYAKKTGQPLLGEPFQQWQYGPVVGSVYSEFRSFGASPISAFAKDANGNAFMVGEDTDRILGEVLDRVWAATKSRSAVELSRITHLPGSAWYRAWEVGNRYLDDAAISRDKSYQQELKLKTSRE